MNPLRAPFVLQGCAHRQPLTVQESLSEDLSAIYRTHGEKLGMVTHAAKSLGWVKWGRDRQIGGDC